jgi:hypothetical protein
VDIFNLFLERLLWKGLGMPLDLVPGVLENLDARLADTYRIDISMCSCNRVWHTF